MNRRVLYLVLLVSCAHALVHLFELSLPGVETLIAAEYAAPKYVMGWLSACWRLPFGLGAFGAGWLVDRFGAGRMLRIYLLGCGAACLAAAFVSSLPGLFVAMFAMGLFASIYHPAGLALISHETNAATLPRALSVHGILGSIGISSAPLLVAVCLALGADWRRFYLVMSIPGVLLGVVFWLWLRDDEQAAEAEDPQDAVEQDQANWPSYFWLTTLAVLQGAVYSAIMGFLPRYLGDLGLENATSEHVSSAALWSSGVLICGCVGQFLAGRIARPKQIEWQLALVTLANTPFLVWMSVATGWQRMAAAALFALVHFMHQPLYNSLIAQYTPRSRRSLAYGFSFAMGLGVGSLGVAFAGYSQDPFYTYGTLALTSLVASAIGFVLWLRSRREADEAAAERDAFGQSPMQ